MPVPLPKSRLLGRRSFVTGAAAASAALSLGIGPARAAKGSPHLRTLARSGVRIPAIGMGTWITFNVGASPRLREARADVLKAFFGAGGTVIDSSPMYGTSEEVVGYCLDRLDRHQTAFSATKVWTPATSMGVDQMAESRDLWGLKAFDLMQVHNLVNWEGHLDSIAEDKSDGKVRYIGITTSHGSRHSAMARIMDDPRVDTVQFTYNLLDRSAEQRLLPMAAERGLGVIVNRPFRRGGLFRTVSGYRLPDWAAEIDCTNWAQFFLKFVISHPAVTCVIPATSNVGHMVENMGALYGRLPDAAMRARMARHVAGL